MQVSRHNTGRQASYRLAEIVQLCRHSTGSEVGRHNTGRQASYPQADVIQGQISYRKTDVIQVSRT
jgi:hypothetical protein